jgi:hypothetical protein
MQGEIMNAALAYAAANGHRGDVINVNKDPGRESSPPPFGKRTGTILAGYSMSS